MADHTFLFADLSGFTALTEAHSDEEAADLAAVFYAEARAQLAEHGGEEVKTLGDAIIVPCAQHGAELFYFCSLSCAEAFAADPGRCTEYAATQSAGLPPRAPSTPGLQDRRRDLVRFGIVGLQRPGPVVTWKRWLN